MTELNGCLLTKEEEEACAELIKKMRDKKTFSFNFCADITIKAKTPKEAEDILWKWQSGVIDYTLNKWNDVGVLDINNFISEEEE